MDDFRAIAEDNYNVPRLKSIFDEHAEKTIDSSDVSRLVGPVHEMIEKGRFDKPQIISWWPQVMVTSVAVATIAVIAFFYRSPNYSAIGTFIEIPDMAIPLAGAPLAAYSDVLANFAIIPAENAGSVTFKLIGAYNDVASRVFNEVTGAYTFADVPDGSYNLVAVIPARWRRTRTVEVASVFVRYGVVDLVLNYNIEEGLGVIFYP